MNFFIRLFRRKYFVSLPDGGYSTYGRDYPKMEDWCSKLSTDDFSILIDKESHSLPVCMGFYFNNKQDALAFRLKFGL